MPLKKVAVRKRIESTSTVGQFDRSKFISLAAYNKYVGYCGKNQSTPERGLEFREAHYPWLVSLIQFHHWDYFISHPMPASLPVVREFFANGSETPGDRIFVRGKRVHLTRTAINRMYNLPDILDEEYSDLMAHTNSEMLEAACEVICDPAAPWRNWKHGRFSINKNMLSPQARVVFHFLCARILPTTHLSTIGRERAILLFCIMSRKKVDVGKIIVENIRAGLRTVSIGSIIYPHTISSLCELSGVHWDAGEEVLQPRAKIDDALLEKIMNENIVHPPQSDPIPDPASRALTIPRQLGIMERRLSQLEVSVGNLLHFTDYQSKVNESIEKCFRNLAIRIGDEDSFPSWPITPDYGAAQAFGEVEYADEEDDDNENDDDDEEDDSVNEPVDDDDDDEDED